jgi:hypothetical protein
MVWIVLVEGIEGILNPELSAATTNQVAQRIHPHQTSADVKLATINKVNQLPMNLLIPGEDDGSGRHILLKTGSSFARPSSSTVRRVKAGFPGAGG